MMKDLEFKLPEGKPPFIGIVFPSEQWALEKNREIHAKYKNQDLKLVVKDSYGRLSMSLQDSYNKEIQYFKMLEYEHEKYKLWRAYTHRPLNFALCYFKNNELKVARTEHGLFVLRIVSFTHL